MGPFGPARRNCHRETTVEMVAAVVTVPTMNAYQNRPRNRDDHAEAFWQPGTADLLVERASPVSNFIQTQVGHRP